MNIISVVPSLTELLFDLDLENEIIGITRFCIHPRNKVKSFTKVGGTKTLKLDRIDALAPDIIIANKEENCQSDIEYLQKKHHVLLTDIYTLSEALTSIMDIGNATNRAEQAELLVHNISKQFDTITPIKKNEKKVAYLIWDNPVMTAGHHTFIHDILHKLGFENVHTDIKTRYPQITDPELQKMQPDFLFLSSEPYPFREKHLKDFHSRFPSTRIILVDGEMFSWYGSRLLLAPKYFNQLIKELN